MGRVVSGGWAGADGGVAVELHMKVRGRPDHTTFCRLDFSLQPHIVLNVVPLCLIGRELDACMMR